MRGARIDGGRRLPELRLAAGRFAIRGKDGKGTVDDTTALYETLTRRFRHGNIAGDSGESIDNEQRIAKASAQDGGEGDAGGKAMPMGADASQIVQQNTSHRHFAYKPNLIVVDGGQPQVAAAAKTLVDCGVDDVALCDLAKRLEEVWVPDDDYPIILKRQSEGMYLLQRVRDESHRFAITYHRESRTKGGLRSALTFYRVSYRMSFMYGRGASARAHTMWAVPLIGCEGDCALRNTPATYAAVMYASSSGR